MVPIISLLDFVRFVKLGIVPGVGLVCWLLTVPLSYSSRTVCLVLYFIQRHLLL